MTELSEDTAVTTTGDVSSGARIYFRHFASGEELSVLDRHDAKAVAASLDVPADWKFIGYFCLGYPQADDTIPELEQSGWERRRLPSSVILRR